MFRKSLESQKCFFPKSVGDVSDMFGHHPWCLREGFKIKEVDYFSKKTSVSKSSENHLGMPMVQFLNS